MKRVRSAGGVVWRREAGGGLEVLVVHRPEYDDWTLPKGKVEPSETDEDGARREVEEETGLRCELRAHLDDVEYEDAEGRAKVARYWEMLPLSGQVTARGEVDEVRWLSVQDAVATLSFDRDRDLVAALAQRRG